MRFGQTRKCYPSNQDSLPVETIIVPKEMRPKMLQYIHKEHQGKERCLLRARNTVFWPKMTYNIQQLIEKCIICQEYGKSQPITGTTQELPPFPWHTLVTDMFYWKRMDFLIVADVFSKYIIVRKLPNSTSAAVCIEPSAITDNFHYLLMQFHSYVRTHFYIPNDKNWTEDVKFYHLLQTVAHKQLITEDCSLSPRTHKYSTYSR